MDEIPDACLDAIRAHITDNESKKDLDEIFTKLFVRLTSFPEPGREEEFCSTDLEKAVLNFIIEATKRGTTTQRLAAILPESPLKDALIDAYKEYHDALKDIMSSIGWEPPRVVDFNWTLCNALESNGDKESGAVIELHFETVPSGSTDIKKFSISCEKDQVQSIWWALKEAQNSINSLKNK